MGKKRINPGTKSTVTNSLKLESSKTTKIKEIRLEFNIKKNGRKKERRRNKQYPKFGA